MHTYFLRCLLVSMSLLILGHSVGRGQDAEDRLRNYNYESYLTEVHGKAGTDPMNLEPRQTRNMALAHFRRARVYEKLYETSLESAIELLRIIHSDTTDEAYQRAMGRLTSRKGSSGPRVSGSSPEVSDDGIEHALLDWSQNEMSRVGCASGNGEGMRCELFNLLLSGGISDYGDVTRLLDEITIRKGSETLINELVQAPTFTGKVDLLMNWVNYLQLQSLADYKLAAWLYEAMDMPHAQVAYFESRAWNAFATFEESADARIEVYRLVGQQVRQQGGCAPGEMPGGWISGVSSDTQRLLVSVDAMSACTSSSLLVDAYGEAVKRVKLPEGSNPQLLADALVAMEWHRRALDMLETQISRTHFFDLTEITPQTAATLMLVKYKVGGAENWGEARRFATLLGAWFEGATPAGLILQLATQTELRQSINLYID